MCPLFIHIYLHSPNSVTSFKLQPDGFLVDYQISWILLFGSDRPAILSAREKEKSLFGVPHP